MTLSPEIVAWIERQCGGRVVEVEQQVRWRPHHFVTLERGAERFTVVARSERATAVDNPTHIDIAREARVLDALQGHDLKVPELLGFSEEFRMILMERVPGTNDLTLAPSDEVRQRVIAEYFEELARLHRIDLAAMDLHGIDVPASPDAAVFTGTYRHLEQDYLARRATAPPDPLLELGRWWVHAHAPQGDRPMSFLQGDTGPGQFMFADGHLTALIDWELAQIGDPMLDLAVVRIRNMIYPTGPLRGPLAHYEEAAGRPIDARALSFYSVLLMLGYAMGAGPSIRNPSAQIPDMLQRIGWDATFRRGLCDALAEACSIELAPLDLPPVPDATDPTFISYLIDQLEVNCLPSTHDVAGRTAISAALAIARTVQRQSLIGEDLLADDLDDLGSVLGRRPSDRNAGLEQLARLVTDQAASQSEPQLERLLQLFARIERRREHLVRPLLITQSSEPFETLRG